MLDLETLGTGTDAAIVSIGACRFDLASGQIQDEFHEKVDFTPSMGKVDPATVLWWLEQGEEARKSLLEGPRSPLASVLQHFRRWVTDGDLKFGRLQGLWSNGPTFDEMILRAAYARLDLTFAVSFRLSRCCRTFFMLATELQMPRYAFEGIKHNALDDARNQARAMCEIHKRIINGPPRQGVEL